MAPVRPDMGVSVNFSPRQVSAEHFPDSVLAALADAGLPPEALTLEVTERVLVEAAGPVVEHLGELRRAGVRLAIDDFGTGYASLAYLRQLRWTSSRSIPRSWPGLGEDETLTLLTRTIVQLGRDLGISVVAEGIESSRQLGMLTGHGLRARPGIPGGRADVRRRDGVPDHDRARPAWRRGGRRRARQARARGRCLIIRDTTAQKLTQALGRPVVGHVHSSLILVLWQRVGR